MKEIKTVIDATRELRKVEIFPYAEIDGSIYVHTHDKDKSGNVVLEGCKTASLTDLANALGVSREKLMAALFILTGVITPDEADEVAVADGQFREVQTAKKKAAEDLARAEAEAEKVRAATEELRAKEEAERAQDAADAKKK